MHRALLDYNPERRLQPCYVFDCNLIDVNIVLSLRTVAGLCAIGVSCIVPDGYEYLF